MAKTTGMRYGTSKIRFIMLEADLGDGDLTEITQAITSALRPSSGQRLIAAPQRESLRNDGPADHSNQDDQAEGDVEPVHESNGPARSNRVRKYRSPKVLTDVELNEGEIGFKAFAEQKGPPEEATRRFLLVAYWFKKYRQTVSITADHVFTCFKKMGWSTAIADFGQPLRDLASKKRLGELARGSFTINHIGEDQVEQMGA